jgi:hypothetical protein
MAERLMRERAAGAPNPGALVAEAPLGPLEWERKLGG